MTFTRSQLQQYATNARGQFEHLLKEFVEIPSVSADPAHKADLERCAELGPPRCAPSAAAPRSTASPAAARRARLVRIGARAGPTITVYNHLDVVPASKETEPWRTEPFTFTSRATRTSAAAPRTTRARRSRRSSAPGPRSRPACR